MKRQYLFLSGFVLIAVAAAFFLWRAGVSEKGVALANAGTAVPRHLEDKASEKKSLPLAIAKPSATFIDKGTSLPPPGTPLKDTFADLQARADAGDAAAASRLFRDLNNCSRLPTLLWRIAGATDRVTAQKTEGMSVPQLRTYQMQLDGVEMRQREAQKIKDLCAGVDDGMLGDLGASLAQAAQLGDVDARACYLGRGPTYDPRSMLDRPDAIQSYRSSAQSMIDAGIAAGDWRVVNLLKSAYEPGAQGLLAGLLGSDQAMYYRYLKLYRLGAEQFRVVDLDRQLAAAAVGLKPEQITAADEWAQTTVQNNFSNPSTAVTPQGWDPCAFP
ncbi:MAG: hypothetical protein J0I77_00365 [Rudaea sp.]|uniref:hypothetical protein n=1 Tax=unclassified Rudaea TaxID=2627037 RepID=UPI0010FA06DC|nr:MULTISPECIES: hypothetical protein [unclassified Rudaea]MBN8884146.1 hypothetical protein [Rudaea sp.]